jgi:hypothetical protein
MAELEAFESAFGPDPDVAYSQSSMDDIRRNRRRLENELFFDKLLKAVGINEHRKRHCFFSEILIACEHKDAGLMSCLASVLYPPRSNEELRKLYGKIMECNAPDQHKSSLVYYILKDLQIRGQGAAKFAKSEFLPNKYQILIDGIWHMDRLQFEVNTAHPKCAAALPLTVTMQEALEYLTDPSLIPTFPEEILHTLCSHCRTDPTLPLAYYHTVSPEITSSGVLFSFFSALCRASVTEAFYFSRARGEASHRTLFEMLVAFVHAAEGGRPRADRAVELINLPLGEEEEEWLEEYLVGGEGSTLFGAKDTVMMRKIATGRTREAVEMAPGMRERTIGDVNWSRLTEALAQRPR